MPVDLHRWSFGLVFSLRNFKNICRQVGLSLQMLSSRVFMKKENIFKELIREPINHVFRLEKFKGILISTGLFIGVWPDHSFLITLNDQMF